MLNMNCISRATGLKARWGVY